MLIIGLTGSIATGKSTVSRLLAAPPHNLPVVDADILARKVTEPGTSCYHAIIEAFGTTTPDLLMPDDVPNVYTKGHGRPLNRGVLGRRVFGSDPVRQRDRHTLNSIVHPAVRRELIYQVLSHYFRGAWAIVLDVPLLFEVGLDIFCGTVILVGIRDPLIQMARLSARDGDRMSESDVVHRISSQGNMLDKAAQTEFRGTRSMSGVVIWNDTDQKQLENEVRAAMFRIERQSPKWYSYILLAIPPLGLLMTMVCFFKNIWNRRQWKKEN